MNVQQAYDMSRRIRASYEYLNAAFAELNAAMAAHNWNSVEDIRLKAQVALDAQIDAIVAFHRVAAEDERTHG